MSAFIAKAQVNVYPTNWWAGMKWNKVQLLIHNTKEGFQKDDFHINYPGITLTKAQILENNKYASLDITIAPDAKPGVVSIEYTKKGKAQSIAWALNKRREGKGISYAQGLNSSDVMYLLMPDRFSNGDVTNDHVAGMRDQSLNRDSIYYRHGGDMQGIINHLDYLQSIGVTSLWMTPVIENDMPDRTEHGYAFTDHYKIDNRLGGSETYKKLSDEVHKRGMKLVQDVVYNHVGLYNVMVQDKPVKDWLHEWPQYTNTTYKDATLMDPHGSEKDKKQMLDGWFTPMMPDLNQSSPLVSNFLIQYALWSVEEFGVDAWRIDTYIYNDLDFMNRCNEALLEEYPKLFMFGETWVNGTMDQAYFAANNFNVPFKSNLPSVTDFQTTFALGSIAQNGQECLNKIYAALSNDFAYKDADKLVTFLGNHDLTRSLTQMKDDVSLNKVALGWLLTSRGIPQLYYGEEVLMKGSTYPKDGYVRLDFPGGWNGDKKNAFTQVGLTEEEKDMQNFVKTLGNYRKSSSAIKGGKLMQFVPKDGIYVYFRYDDNQTVMIVMNVNEASKDIKFSDYDERTKNFSSGKDVIKGNAINSTFTVPAKSIAVVELVK